VYFAEFHLRNVPQITRYIFFTFRKIQIKSNNKLRVGLGLHFSLESTSAHHKRRGHSQQTNHILSSST